MIKFRNGIQLQSKIKKRKMRIKHISMPEGMEKF